MPDHGIMDSGDAQEPADVLQWALPQSQKKVVLVLDLVESVRLMASDERRTVRRWMDFAHHADSRVIPTHQGRLVKSLGDGLRIEFEQPHMAVAAAQALHDALERDNLELPAQQHMRLRAGINVSQVYADERDIYGAGVNLAARLADLAQPGETVVSASMRDALVEGVDACLEDLGDCYLKHMDEPVRAYRVLSQGAPQRMSEPAAQLLPVVAVIPFQARSNEPEHFAIGELMAEGVIATLSRSGQLKVISRLSTTVFRQRGAALDELQNHLGAHYVLSGSYVASSGKLLVSVELAHTHNHQVVWAQRLSGDVQDLLQADSELCHRLAEAICRAVLDTEVQKTRTQPLPTLQSYSLLLGGINMMHHATPRDFERSRQVLELLLDRHRKAPAIRAWLAMWYVLKTTRGLAGDPSRDAAQALDLTGRALDIEPENPLALAVQGFVHCHLKRDLDTAWAQLNKALCVDPNAPLAWLYMSTIESLRGETGAAMACAQRAMDLSPLDPQRYYYLSLAGSAANFDGQWARAAELLERARQLNRSHAPTLRALVIAYSELGRHETAQRYLKELLAIQPGMTVRRYLSDSPGGIRYRERFAHAMARVGLPQA